MTDNIFKKNLKKNEFQIYNVYLKKMVYNFLHFIDF